MNSSADPAIAVKNLTKVLRTKIKKEGFSNTVILIRRLLMLICLYFKYNLQAAKEYRVSFTS